MIDLIHRAGFHAVQRDTYYNTVREIPLSDEVHGGSAATPVHNPAHAPYHTPSHTHDVGLSEASPIA
jgi:hypothetical protein